MHERLIEAGTTFSCETRKLLNRKELQSSVRKLNFISLLNNLNLVTRLEPWQILHYTVLE